MATLRMLLPALLLLGSCGGKPAAAAAVDGTLVLEVGGDQPSLSGDLRRLGVELRPAPGPAALPPSPQIDPPPRPVGDPPVHEPPPPPDPEPAYIEIELKTGQTIGALAQQYLGTSRRYQEILDLNHLTEASARRIKAGSRIKIPKDAANPGRR